MLLILSAHDQSVKLEIFWCTEKALLLISSEMSFMYTFFIPEEAKVEEGEWEKER